MWGLFVKQSEAVFPFLFQTLTLPTLHRSVAWLPTSVGGWNCVDFYWFLKPSISLQKILPHRVIFRCFGIVPHAHILVPSHALHVTTYPYWVISRTNTVFSLVTLSTFQEGKIFVTKVKQSFEWVGLFKYCFNDIPRALSWDASVTGSNFRVWCSPYAYNLRWVGHLAFISTCITHTKYSTNMEVACFRGDKQWTIIVCTTLSISGIIIWQLAPGLFVEDILTLKTDENSYRVDCYISNVIIV
jgi:hypothetical protein